MPQPPMRVHILGEGLFAAELTAAFSRAGASIVPEGDGPDLVIWAPPLGPPPEPVATDTIPTAEQRALCEDRERMRRLATEELEFPTSRYGVADSPTRLKAVIDLAIGYPCIVKPRAVSGAPPRVVDGPRGVEAAWAALSRGGEEAVVVESYIDNALDLILPAVGGRDTPPRFCRAIGLERGGRIESWQPHRLPPRALLRAQQMAETLVDRLALTGVVGVRFLLKGADILFNRFTFGPDAVALVTLVSQVQNVFDLHARALLGLPLDTALRQAGAGVMICGGRAFPEGGQARALRYGATLEGDCSGVVLAGAATAAEARSRARRAAG